MVDPTPPFEPQQQPFPGMTEAMVPRPDDGRDSYRGSGRLSGKRALITGGDSGIGAAVAIAFAREGADVAISYLPDEQADAESIATIVKQAGARALLLPGDISDDAHGETLIERVCDAFGGLDTFVSNAAYQAWLPKFDEITMSEWRRHFAVNVDAAFNLVRLAVPHMPEGSSITFTSSVNSKHPMKTLLPYSATKGALSNLTIGLAQALADKVIRVNAVLPGPIWTPFIPAGMDEQSVKSFGSDTPFGRPGQPAELAGSYVLLASDESSYTSGALLTIAGGMPLF